MSKNRPVSLRLYKLLFCLVLINSITIPASAQDSTINYDEARMPPYTLPDPLQLANGKRISTAREWIQNQRPAMLKLFADHVYGKMPGKPKGIHFDIKDIDSFALDGKAIRKQLTIFFTAASAGPSIDVLMYLPKFAMNRVPVFIGLNFNGNHTINKDPGILLTTKWVSNNANNNRATESSRGLQAARWPVEELVDRGYGLVTAYYGDLEPDNTEGWKTGIRTTMQSALGIDKEQWGAIGAWAWGLSRIMDYLQTDRSVNSQQVVLTGHSRLGKAALWAGANDTRFAIVVANESGEGGAALSRRWIGETIKRINTAFPHWFIARYKQYNDNVHALPVDQHILLALIAPRPLYVASADEDTWADPKGEFLSAQNAEPVYALFGKKGLGVKEMPTVNHPVGETIRYHIRTGKHDMTFYDWQQYLDFADKHFKKIKRK
jgi:hypothetical protein